MILEHLIELKEQGSAYRIIGTCQKDLRASLKREAPTGQLEQQNKW